MNDNTEGIHDEKHLEDLLGGDVDRVLNKRDLFR